MQVTYRIPSKKVQYGYLEFTREVEDETPEGLALAYADFILRYNVAERNAFETWTPGKKPEPEEDINDVALDAAADTIKDSLGATEINESDPVAPWDKPTEETTTKKDWDVSDGDWDFG